MPEPLTAHSIIARVCREYRNSDLRADNRVIGAAIDAEFDFFRRRITELQAANTAEVERRRRFEQEANEEHAEYLLVRNECIRLREQLCTLAAFIDECHRNSGERIPGEIADAMEAYFPPEAITDTMRVNALERSYREQNPDAAPIRETIDSTLLSGEASA